MTIEPENMSAIDLIVESHAVAHRQGVAARFAYDVSCLLCYRDDFLYPNTLKSVRYLAKSVLGLLDSDLRLDRQDEIAADTSLNFDKLVDRIQRVHLDNPSFSIHGVDLPLRIALTPESAHWLNVASRIAVAYMEIFDSCPEISRFISLDLHLREFIHLMNGFKSPKGSGSAAVFHSISQLRTRLALR